MFFIGGIVVLLLLFPLGNLVAAYQFIVILIDWICHLAFNE